MRDLPSVLAWARTTAWAIDPRFGRPAYTALLRRALGQTLSHDEIADALAAPRASVEAHERAAAMGQQKTGGSVAVIPILGMIRHRGGNFADASGNQYAGLQSLTHTLRAADADPSIKSIVLDVDSPGGSVDGLIEATSVIRSLSTPVIGVANTLAASAAYWLLAQADLVYASPSAMVGSVGVYSMHVDESEYLAQEGLSVSLISAGEFKVEGNSFGPLDDGARARMQAVVDDAYREFIGAVATGRGTTAKKVLSDFGGGRVLTAREALSAGMIDRIGTLDDAIERAARGRISKRAVKAESEPITVRASDPVEVIEVEPVEARALEHKPATDAMLALGKLDRVSDPNTPPKQAGTLSRDAALTLLELELMSAGSRD